MNISIIGGGTTKFGELWNNSPRELAREAFGHATMSSGVKKDQIDALFVGNMLGGILGNQENIGAFYAEELDLTPIPAFRIEGACASGGLALHNGVNALKSGMYKTVAVLGVEKMTDAGGDLVASALMAAGSDEERQSGITFPGLYAIMARAYMDAYKVTEDDLSEVSVLNHLHGSFNSKAQFKFKITKQDVLESAKIADPLRLLDCSPVTDGAACIIISSDEKYIGKNSVEIVASEVGTDTLSLSKRETLTSIRGVKDAARRAFAQAKITPSDVTVAEVHDCFSIAELIAIEDLGFSKEGQAINDLKKGMFTRQSGKIVINPSGGLKACGHPVGATGIKQAVEVYEQLLGIAGEKQAIKPGGFGLTHNVGGSGAVAAVHILKKG